VPTGSGDVFTKSTHGGKAKVLRKSESQLVISCEIRRRGAARAA
jgi:hypothetical protein